MFPKVSLVVAFILVSLHSVSAARAQDTGTSSPPVSSATIPSSSALSDYGQEELSNSTWEFGLEVRSVGEAKNVTGAFPVPIEWPEQTLTLSKPIKTQNVTRVTTKDYVTAKMVEFEMPRLAPGETARCVIRCSITKHTQREPDNFEAFRFPVNPGNELRPFLRASPQIESTHPKIVKLAKETIPFSDSDTPWQQVKTIYEWVRDNIEYRFEETNRPAIEALNNKRGDCGEMTGLFVAICRARGIPV
jgi:transglutaminase-like putative cysteine protease